MKCGTSASAAGATAWLLASADAGKASRIASIVASEGERRVQLEQTEGAKLAAAAPDRAAAETREATIVAAWRKWYGEAVQSATRLVIGPVPAEFEKTLALLAKPFITAPGTEPFARRSRRPDVRWMPSSRNLHGVDIAQNPRRFCATPIFTCGTDQMLPDPIPVRWSTVVLAGDGRLYLTLSLQSRARERTATTFDIERRARRWSSMLPQEDLSIGTAGGRRSPES